MSFVAKHGAAGGQNSAVPPKQPASQPAAQSVMHNVSPEMRQGIIETAAALKLHPAEVASLISYETGGSMNPMQAGPTTKWGQHRGFIQFGEPQAKQYGVDFSSPEAAVKSQLGANGAIVKYALASGFKPGEMNGLNLYAAINAGSPYKTDASDAQAGGAPGSVADKYFQQMGGHRTKMADVFGAPEGVEFSQWVDGDYSFNPYNYDYGTNSGIPGGKSEEELRREQVQGAIYDGTNQAFGGGYQQVMGDTGTYGKPVDPIQVDQLELQNTDMGIPPPPQLEELA